MLTNESQKNTHIKARQQLLTRESKVLTQNSASNHMLTHCAQFLSYAVLNSRGTHASH